MAEVKWIKIVTDVFDNRKIKLIESMPEGDTIIVIWFKLLCVAGQTNDGGVVYFTKDIPFNHEMLAQVFNRPVQIIRLAMKTFVDFGMIEVVDDFIQITSWEKYQNVEGLDKIREANRKRVQRYRERQKAETPALPEAKREPGLPFPDIVSKYQELCPRMPSIKTLSEKRKRTLKAWGNMEEIIEVFTMAGQSDFLCGVNDRNWTANFDWIIKPENRIKILEGQYKNKEGSNGKPGRTYNSYKGQFEEEFIG